MGRLISPFATAVLLILMVKRYGAERERPLPRARISRKTFRKVSGRKTIREAFTTEVRAACIDLGWELIELTDAYGLVEIDSADGWTQVASSRVSQDLKKVRSGALDEDDLLELLESGSDDEDGENATDDE